VKRRGLEGDGGAVTIELALALPSVVAILGFVLAGAAWLRADMVATHAAASAARIALTDSASEAEAVARRIAGDAARIVVDTDGGWVSVQVVMPGAALMPDAQATVRAPAQQ